VSYSDSVLLSGSLWSVDFHLPGTPPKSRKTADYMPVGPDFFSTMKIPVLRGRNFKPEEYELTAKVEADKQERAKIAVPAIVNETFVADNFPNVNPLGQPFGDYVPGVNGDPSPDATASAGLSRQNDNVLFEQSRNVLLTGSSLEVGQRTTTDDPSRARPAGGPEEGQEETDHSKAGGRGDRRHRAAGATTPAQAAGERGPGGNP
ncbi:MAG TPA: hypothetical protein VMB80_07895, partial [Candidatus Acidoferrum sp.]|nr:hypothetical protein [Candidatus Acidoferrum sp.]